jgi:hypothetical protein
MGTWQMADFDLRDQNLTPVVAAPFAAVTACKVICDLASVGFA